ncbi:hypothetical protein [Deinococcus depolymerans]|uniref:hypothetical protein n=1 Tax=Deinococcus depolymerans TaxID=392408 RepID=UPI0031DCCEC6
MTPRDAPFLLARVHLPEDRTTSFIYRRFGDNVGAMDGSVFHFQRGGHGVIRIVPMTPDLWTHLKPGTSLAMTFERLHAQVTQSLMENQA